MEVKNCGTDGVRKRREEWGKCCAVLMCRFQCSTLERKKKKGWEGMITTT